MITRWERCLQQMCPFPGTDEELATLTGPQLQALASFYREDFGGTVDERRMAFARFVTAKN